MDIEITVKNKIAAADKQVIICGNSDYVVRFKLDDEWAGYKTKTMRVDLMNGTHEDVLFEGDSCPLPVIHDRTRIAVGIYAGAIRTTTPAVLCCEKCITDAGGVAASPTEDVYSQLLRRLNDFDGYWLPEVSESGELSWTRQLSEQTPDTVNIKGTKGDTGAKGDKGDSGSAATVTIGTVTTGAAGSAASVVNSGTPSAAVLDFVIPRGVKGDKGNTGSADDYIIAHGTTNGWSWCKWNSGAAECWGRFTRTIAGGYPSSLGGFRYTAVQKIAFPFAFSEQPALIVDGGSSNMMNLVRNFGTSATEAGFVVVGIDASTANLTVQANIYARGDLANA